MSSDLKSFLAEESQFSSNPASVSPAKGLETQKEFVEEESENQEEENQEVEYTNEETNEENTETEIVEEKEDKKPSKSNEDKRLRDAQAKISQMGETNKRLKSLLNRYDNLLKKDEQGEPIEWDFTSLSKPIEVIAEPTDEEWDINPKLAVKKEIERNQAILKEQIRKEIFDSLKEKEQKLVIEQAKINFDKAWNESFVKAVKDFPDYKKEDSELRLKAEEIYNEDPEKWGSMANANYRLAALASLELGKVSKKVVTKEVKKSTLMGLGQKTNSTIKTNNIPKHLQDFKDAEERFKKRE